MIDLCDRSKMDTSIGASDILSGRIQRVTTGMFRDIARHGLET